MSRMRIARHPKKSLSKKPRKSKPKIPVHFPIVGVGASAGGLEAFTQLVRHLPPDTGMAFVLVQHLDPDHASALTQILSKTTALPIDEVTDRMPVKPNHIYVIPPNVTLSINRRVLRLQPRAAKGSAARSIDSFFESLAHDQHGCAIGVVLSGAASDGTQGLEAIKAEGGITFAQDNSAAYDSMPSSAIAAGCVDFVLSPEQMVKELVRIARHPFIAAEELETSKEELESSNEELITVNEEMMSRNADLNRLNNDLVNLQSSTRLSILLLGRDLHIRRFSPQAEKQFNLMATDLGRPLASIRHDLEIQDLENFVAEVITNVREVEREVCDKQGRWHLLRAGPYLTLDNKVDGAVLALVDIDRLKRSEQDLMAARDQAEQEVERARVAEAILATARDPLLILNSDFRIHSANAAFYRTFTATRENTEHHSIFDLDSGQWKIPQLRSLLDNIIPRNSFFDNLEVTFTMRDGGRRTFLLDGRKLKDQNDRILLGIQDITERKEAEKVLLEAQKTIADRAGALERLVQSRTSELQETVTELEHFSYTISHDMRTPLRAMQGFSEMLVNEFSPQLPPEAVDYLMRIKNGASRMDALILDALQYTKILHGEIPLLAIEPFAVWQGIISSYPNFQPPKADIQVVNPLPTVIANEAGLSQCFSNFLSNAVKFVEPGATAQVRIRAETRGESVRLWVEDKGIGIAPEYHERIFGMFQQLDKHYEGTGIGLALVHKVAARMGGTVGVESEPGQGSRFWLELKKA